MIAIDWGGSSLRAYRMSDVGAIIERRNSPAGIFRPASRPFGACLDALVGDWFDGGEAEVVMSGMIGSRNGWAEAPYLPCPARLADLATGGRDVEWGSRRAWIAPGLVCRAADGAADVMRGEEVQVLGLANQLPDSALICLPGTHTKWVEASGGTITGFRTAVTGELFGLLQAGSSLLAPPPDQRPIDPQWFAAGLERADRLGGILQHLFGVRAGQLVGDLSDTAAASFLSGILVGHDVANAPVEGCVVHLLGATELVSLYQVALARRGVAFRILDPDAAATGLFALARARTALAQ